MAKIEIQIEDLGGTDMRVSIKSDCDFPADTAKWTTAQHAAMAVHHNLGVSRQDLADTGPIEHTRECAIDDDGWCSCGAMT
jgi:hypothetical protein